MTKQTVFNKVVRHLRQQNRRAMNPYGSCQYRTPDGDKCAIGCLIPSKDYKKSMEGQSVEGLRDDKVLPKHLLRHVELLSRLQCLHDNTVPNEWEARLEHVAKDFKLTMPN